MPPKGDGKVEALKQDVAVPDGSGERADVRGDVVEGLKQEPKSSEAVDDVVLTVEGLMNEDAELKVETVKDLRKLGVEVLMKLENKYEGILMYAFTNVVDGGEVLDFKEWDEYKKPVAGMKVKVDFMGNKAAEEKVGAADLFPPSVRRITVYDQGNEQDARTSERRIGLKGQNVDGRGFFDKQGYIPVYSGDVVVIGGAKDSENGVDVEFEKKFRKEGVDGAEGELDYEAYAESDEAIKDKEFMADLMKRNPRARTRKEWSDDEIDALIDGVEASGISKRVVEAASDLIKEKYSPAHCWDWIDKVYKRAGVGGRHIIFRSLNYSGKDCGENHASEQMLDKIRPGDWIYYNNKNSADSQGNHSALFIGWIDEGNRIAQFASGYYGRPGRIHKRGVDLVKNPVVLIKKPTV